ncbi:O-acetylhomoserine sulfhydrylase / O-succinylhomoserine sulfhydrylase [Paramagnetospirillum magnetotacticum MS-1]|uniref:O-succinylhomoserine sulfhydrylase n=1 Tax=Paramagnetospirillum magnetotacticum MS-1 TaxID=272627 RepID=A0A0C2U7K9_PARME|nr:O-succinylhomoserine sulfhydrylase [Paramagnetospirillum magnetotacticum]KIL97457.1 O-acetylhomoserine sulfhydrylase / O-succinylhomoserine sulfhydrylase [Paramagnetospirillum magnetotacticum MS-1]
MSNSDSKPARTWRPRTQAVRGGLSRTNFRETSEAMFMNSGYVYDSAEEAEASFDGTLDRMVYSRFKNPTIAVFEQRLAEIEGAPACRATASGMAAVHAALLCQLKAGDRVVASNALFGSCHWIINELLPRYGIERVFVDGTDLKSWEAALSRPTACVFLETPSNPTLEIIDLAAVCDLAHKAGAKVVVDNVFATPILQSPLELGADIVVYSATKHIDGQGRCLGGAVLGSTEFCADILGPFLRNTGPCMSPFNAWVLLKGLETLDLRMERHCSNALKLARFLETRGEVARVLYPGLESHPQHDLAKRQMRGWGSIVALELKGGKQAAYDLLNGLDLIDISNNLGDAKSLITHPWTTTHQRLSPEDKLSMGITEGLLRLSVGLEDGDDLADDIAQALES